MKSPFCSLKPWSMIVAASRQKRGDINFSHTEDRVCGMFAGIANQQANPCASLVRAAHFPCVRAPSHHPFVVTIKLQHRVAGTKDHGGEMAGLVLMMSIERTKQTIIAY